MPKRGEDARVKADFSKEISALRRTRSDTNNDFAVGAFDPQWERLKPKEAA
jgi:hypothetical protein